MQNQRNERHAIVIGGSMAGLLAGRVLADVYDRVTIIDRDTFPQTPDHRAGVPQSHHVHALLGRGQAIIEQFFPGIVADLRADGATSAHDVVPIIIVSPAGKLPALPAVGEFVAFSRYLLEWHVRHRLAQRPNVHFLPNCEVEELLATPDRRRVTSVRVHRRDQADSTQTLQGDLIVDASGRHSHAPQWLHALGYDTPPEETINSGLCYASRFYRKPLDFPASWQGIIINGRPPHNPRAGLILPVDHDRWHVSVGGFAGHYPPTDEDGFLQWAHDLADPSIYEALRVAEPLTPIRGYRTPENRWRHYERLRRWPAGLIATGDSVCAFNPIYRQGMTVSAMDALVLQASLREQRQTPRHAWEHRFQRRLAKTVAGVWAIASGEDLRWDGVELRGARPSPWLALRHRFTDLVLRRATTDPLVTQAYMQLISMEAPASTLFRPNMLLRVLAGALQGDWSHQGNAEPWALSSTAIALLQARPSAQHA